MKNKLVLIACMITILIVGFTGRTQAQSENKDCSVINIFRSQESMFSGGRTLVIKLYLNDKEVTSILTGTKITIQTIFTS